MAEAVGSHEEEKLGKAYDARLLRRLLRYVRPYRARVALAVLALLCGAALELVGPWLTKIALDRAIPAGDLGLLRTLALLYAGALVAAFALEYGQAVLTAWLGQRIMYDLRREIFGRLQNLSLSFFDRNPVGRLMTRVTSDVEVLNQLFSSGIVTVFGDVFTLTFIMIAMLVMNWRLALVTFTVLPLVFLAAFLFRSRIRDASRDVRTRLARLNAYLQERISGIAVVRLFVQEDRVGHEFREVDRGYLGAYLREVRYYALFFPIIEVLTAVAFALIVWYGGVSVMDGTLTVGVIAAFLQWARRFFRPIQDLSEKYNMLQGAMASSERIFSLLDAEAAAPVEPEVAARPAMRLPEPGRGEIEFRDVWFAYRRAEAGPEGGANVPPPRGEDTVPPPVPGRSSPDLDTLPQGKGTAPSARGGGTFTQPPDGGWDWVLRGVSFRVRPGEKVAIVGHTGAGKTSIISLLMRFYEPQHGEILFDGVPISHVPVHELRERIGLVLQDVFLFSRDVGYNLRLGRTDIDEARARQAAARVGADRVVGRLQHGYETPVGERGASLSVGERQLLSFARALAFDPLVLVLDEATSSVDSELEAQIEDAVDTLMEDRTAIVIAHRLSTIQHADTILVLHHGELREQGSHAELLEKGGLYARLYELQFASAPAAPAERAAGD